MRSEVDGFGADGGGGAGEYQHERDEQFSDQICGAVVEFEGLRDGVSHSRSERSRATRDAVGVVCGQPKRESGQTEELGPNFSGRDVGPGKGLGGFDGSVGVDIREKFGFPTDSIGGYRRGPRRLVRRSRGSSRGLVQW